LTKTDSSSSIALQQISLSREAAALGWRGVQADHNDRMAKLADADAAAYEGDAQFATSSGQRAYLVQRARRHRKEARVRRATAEELRSHGWR
jgi:hypothetical protein